MAIARPISAARNLTMTETSVTDASGQYLFEGLAAGSYVVQVDTADPDFPSDVTATGDPDVDTGRIGDFVWLDADGNGELTKAFRHICWDGCMFPPEVMMNPKTWTNILAAMIKVRDKHGWVA